MTVTWGDADRLDAISPSVALMGAARWLTDLAAVVAGAGLVVHEEPGWETRARSSGGYVTGPVGIVVHHTASGPSSDGQPDVDFCCYVSDIKPICGLYLSRKGEVWVCAAGATNHAGAGGPYGPIPTDDANRRCIGIEAANTGTGEPWPQVQQESYCRLVEALVAAYAIDPALVIAHAEWAPSRKIDPAGPSRWATGSATWTMSAFRADIVAGWPSSTPTPPTPDPTPPSSGYPGAAARYDTGPTVLAWQEAMIWGGWISDNPANRDSFYGDGMYRAVLGMQQGFGWSDADGIAGPHTWDHMCSRGAPPCPRCGK